MTTPTKKWHDFREDEFGEDVCRGCGCTVTLEGHMTFTLPCPVPACTSPKNPDSGCAFSPNARRDNLSSCLYCGRPGERAGEESHPHAGIPSPLGPGAPDVPVGHG
jgi:hypothetical protein